MQTGASGRKLIYIDAFKGEIKSDVEAINSTLGGFLVEIHANLLLGKNGKIFVGILGILALFISLTGFMIYRNFWKNLLMLRFKKLAVFMRDIHKFVGVFSTPILLVIALTGAWWELRFLFTPKFNANSAPKEQKLKENLSIQSFIDRANFDMGGLVPHFITFPSDKNPNVTLYGYKKGQNFLYDEYANQLKYDANSGELVNLKDTDSADFADKFFSSFRKAHFGYYSDFTKIIWFVIGLTPLILGISGFYLWIKKINYKRRKDER